MRGGGARRRRLPNPTRASASAAATPLAHHGGGRRESDVSLCSSRPSSASLAIHSVPNVSDKSYQNAALRFVNAYLNSHSFPSLRSLASARDITETLHFVLNRLDCALPSSATTLEDDLPPLLKHLNCPFKLNKSALKAPGTPHAWPHIIAALHFLVQLAIINDHLSSATTTTTSFARGNYLLDYTCRSYRHFINGEDDAVEALDEEHVRKAQDQVANAAAAMARLEKEAAELDLKIAVIRSGPSPREALERERDTLREDVKKFETIIENFAGKVLGHEKVLEEKENLLEAKVVESQRICEENEELKKKVGSQAVNVRDMERMRKELQAVESDAAEAEIARNALEDRSWELSAAVERKLGELQPLVEECNQAIRRLKLGNNFQYVLNDKGASPADVLGTDYKTMLKPTLNALANEIKESSVAKLEELISLQQQSRESATMLDEKRERLVSLQIKIDEAEARSASLKKEMEDHEASVKAEVRRMKDEVEQRESQLINMEDEVQELLKNAELRLQDATRESEEEVQLCACELVGLIDAVSEYKEYMESTISGMKKDLSEAALSVSEKLISASQSISHIGSKRPRLHTS